MNAVSSGVGNVKGRRSYGFNLRDEARLAAAFRLRFATLVILGGLDKETGGPDGVDGGSIAGLDVRGLGALLANDEGV